MQSLPSLSMSGGSAKLRSESPGALSCDKLTVLACTLGTANEWESLSQPTCEKGYETIHPKKHAFHIKWFGFKLVFEKCCE